MLLDRKRINKWAKWVALFLAIVFAGGFLFMGVGYGGAGFNVSEAFSCANEQTADNAQTPEQKLDAYKATLAKNPNDTAALLAIANIYQQQEDYVSAAAYLENLLAVDPAQKDAYIRLANLYISKIQTTSAYEAAVKTLNKAATVEGDNPDVYLKLGIAQSELGNKEAAVLAWQKYLELAPNGDMAPVIKEQIETLTATTTTTTAATTSTTASSGTAATSSTAANTGTTGGSTTTSTPQ